MLLPHHALCCSFTHFNHNIISFSSFSKKIKHYTISCTTTANNRHLNNIIIRAPPSDVISIACGAKWHQRSRHHPMHILDTPSRRNPTPTLYIVGSTGNEYQMVVTRTSITCSCPDNHQGCKHILALLHLTTTSHRRGNYIYVTPSYLIDKIQNKHCFGQITSILCLTEYVLRIIKQTVRLVISPYLVPFLHVQNVRFPIICDATYHPTPARVLVATANS